MNYTKKIPDFKQIFTLCIALIAGFITLGIVFSFKSTGTLLSESVAVIRKVSFENTGFLKTFSKAVHTHFWYSISILIFSSSFPGGFLPGGYIAFRSFFAGITVGLAAKSCTVAKATSVCFAVFMSNVLILPLYIFMFFISIRFSMEAKSGGMFCKNTLKEYFSFLTKVLVVFALMCVAECVQTALGVAILKIATM